MAAKQERKESEEFAGVTSEELLVRVARRDAHALRGLVERHGEELEELVANVLGERRKWLRSRVEDVCSTVWIEVMDCAGKFEHRSSFKTWLIGIAFKVAHRHMKKLLKTARRERQAEVDAEGEEVTLDGETRPVPELIAGREIASDLNAAVEALPPRQGRIYKLREAEKRSWDEVVAITGETRPSLRCQLRQAMEALPGLLSKHEPEPGAANAGGSVSLGGEGPEASVQPA